MCRMRRTLQHAVLSPLVTSADIVIADEGHRSGYVHVYVYACLPVCVCGYARFSVCVCPCVCVPGVFDRCRDATNSSPLPYQLCLCSLLGRLRNSDSDTVISLNKVRVCPQHFTPCTSWAGTPVPASLLGRPTELISINTCAPLYARAVPDDPSSRRHGAARPEPSNGVLQRH